MRQYSIDGVRRTKYKVSEEEMESAMHGRPSFRIVAMESCCCNNCKGADNVPSSSQLLQGTVKKKKKNTKKGKRGGGEDVRGKNWGEENALLAIPPITSIRARVLATNAKTSGVSQMPSAALETIMLASPDVAAEEDVCSARYETAARVVLELWLFMYSRQSMPAWNRPKDDDSMPLLTEERP